MSNWDPSSLSSNSNYSFNSRLRTFGHYDHSGIKSSNYNYTDTNDLDFVDLSPYAGKLMADKTEEEINAKINGTPGDQVKENSQSEADTNSGADGNPENIRVEWLGL